MLLRNRICQKGTAMTTRHLPASGLQGQSTHPRDDASGEGGFILAMLGLMIIPMMIFTALAVDVASFYSRTSQLQKAADAASLAAVVWMPDQTRADQVAAATMQRNGFVNGVDNIQIDYQPGVSGPNTYRVVATDTKARTFFSQVFYSGDIHLDRGATASVDPPLQMGSPLNYFGGDDNNYPGTSGSPGGTYYSPAPDNNSWPSNARCYYKTGRGWDGSRYRDYGYRYNTDGTRNYIWFPDGYSPLCQWVVPPTPATPSPIRSDMNPGFWAAVEAPYTDAVQGERYGPRCYGDGSTSCVANGHANPEYRTRPDGTPRGYYYTLRMPSAPPSKVVVQVFDAAFVNRGQTVGTGDNQWENNNNWYTDFTMYNYDNTPFDPSDNPQMSASSCGGSSGNNDGSGKWSLQANSNNGFRDAWRTLCVINNPVAGAVYALEVGTHGTGGNASNNYALRAIGTGADASLNPLDNNYPNYPVGASQQPNLAAFGNMAMYNNLVAGTANFYLAKVPGRYAGRTLDIELYDPGEGSGVTVQLNTPSGIQQGCTYKSERLVNFSGGYNNDGGSINSATALTTIGSGNDCSFATSGRFNGNVVTIKVPIPVGYTCNENINTTWWSSSPSTAGCWWSVSFNSSGAHDNTTWSASIEGDPIRLIE